MKLLPRYGYILYLLNDPTSSITRRKAYRDMFPSRMEANIFYAVIAIESQSDMPLAPEEIIYIHILCHF